MYSRGSISELIAFISLIFVVFDQFLKIQFENPWLNIWITIWPSLRFSFLLVIRPVLLCFMRSSLRQSLTKRSKPTNILSPIHAKAEGDCLLRLQTDILFRELRVFLFYFFIKKTSITFIHRHRNSLLIFLKKLEFLIWLPGHIFEDLTGFKVLAMKRFHIKWVIFWNYKIELNFEF